MNTRILVVIGTPIPASLNHALANAYAESARSSGAEVRVIDLAVQPVPAHPEQREQLRTPRDERDVQLDADVATYIDDVRWADHITIFYPQWWGTYPAALTAFIDRVFLSGFAFRYHSTGKGWDRLLVGRTARLVMTMDSPNWWVRLMYRDSAVRSLARATLWYCGIRVRGVTRFAEVRHQPLATIESWIRTAAQLGARDAAAAPAMRAPEPVAA